VTIAFVAGLAFRANTLRELYIPGLVPAAGRAVTGGAALDVAGNEGGAAFVLVDPNVIRGGDACIFGVPAPIGVSASRPIAPIATAAPTPIAASADLGLEVFNRCPDTMASTPSM
jgi:hypothetical protein